MSEPGDNLRYSSEVEINLENSGELASSEAPAAFVYPSATPDASSSLRSSVDLSGTIAESKEDLGNARFVILAIALICSIWSAGLIFGWAPLYGTLLRAGVYSGACPPSPIVPISYDNNTMLSTSSDVIASMNATSEVPLCKEQQKKLNLVYTAGSALTQASLFVSGIVLDWRGPKTASALSALIVSLGAFIFGSASAFHVDFLYILGFAMMGFGGAGINLATYTVSNLFPSHKSWVVSSLVGVWTLSSLWFLMFRPAFNAGISLHALFFAQSILLLLTAVVFWLTFPTRALREGERFSFHQWLPWNVSAHELHTSMSTIDTSTATPLKTFHDFIAEEAQVPRTIDPPAPFTNLPSPAPSPSLLSATTSAIRDSEISHSSESSRSSFSQDEFGTPIPTGQSSHVFPRHSVTMEEPVALELPFADLVHGFSRFGAKKSSQSAFQSSPSIGSQWSMHPIAPSTMEMSNMQADDEETVDLDLEEPASRGNDNTSETVSSFGSDEESIEEVDGRSAGATAHGLAMAKAVWQDMKTVDFVLLSIWFAVHVLFFEFYIGTIADALDYRTRQRDYPLGPAIETQPPATKTIDAYVMAFNLIYAVGFVFVPMYAWTTDHLGFVGSFFLATLFAFAYPLASMLPGLPTQFLAYTLYSSGIQFVYSCQFGFIAHRFGYQHFGALVGAMGILAACLIPLQPAFLRLVLNKFSGNFFFMYLIQACIALPLFTIVIWNWINTRRRISQEMMATHSTNANITMKETQATSSKG